MKKYTGNDQLFRNSMMKDNPHIEPDKAIEYRLNHYFLMKRSSHKVHSNSFEGLFVWIFSLKSLGLKAGFATVCLAYFLFIGNINTKTVNQQFSDTCQVNTVAVDTNYMVKDTCK
jgi:hypothetical protein